MDFCQIFQHSRIFLISGMPEPLGLFVAIVGPVQEALKSGVECVVPDTGVFEPDVVESARIKKILRFLC